MSFEIRPLTDADREGAFAVRTQAFSAGSPAFDADADYVPDDRRLVAVAGDEVVGHVGVWPHGQWFGGRRVPVGGVGGVAVAPPWRRRGVGSALLRRALDDMRERGDVASTLYPMAYAPYRRLGWEVAGTWMQREVPTRALTELPRPGGGDITFTRVTADDVAAMDAVHDEVSRHHDGNLQRQEPYTSRMIGPDEDHVGYVARRGGEVVGYVWYEHTPADERTRPGESYGLTVWELVGADADVELALWRLVGSSASAAFTTRFVSRPDDPLLLWLTDPNEVRAVAFEHQWLSRLVDAPAAVAARGFRAGVRGRVPLDVVDPVLEANAGRWQLVVEDGSGELRPGGDGRVRLDVGAFASLWTGWASAWTLAQAGRIAGATTDDLQLLTDAFGGPMPWVRNYF